MLYTRRLSIILAFIATCSIGAHGWSKKGHQIVASVAQEHLLPQVRSTISTLLNGDNIVYWAAWLDSARDDAEYAHTSTWHYINVEAGDSYDDRWYEPAGDAVYAMDYCYDVLTDPDSEDKERADAIKIAVHVLGDLHQPMHAGHKTDYGGNSVRLKFDGYSTTLHSLWDYYIVEASHDWSYYLWREYLLDGLTDDEIDEMSVGKVDDWARESVEVAAEVYDYFTPGGSYGTADVDVWRPVVERQLLHGGLRLGRWLNDVVSRNAGVATTDGHDRETGVDVYTVTGVKVASGVDNPFDSLPPGLYIVGKRKVAICR